MRVHILLLLLYIIIIIIIIIIFHLQLWVSAGPNAQVRKLSLDQLSAQV